MATKQEILTAIDSKIKTEGNISAVDTNKILKDIVEFSDKPVTPANIDGFDFGNLDNPLETNQLASVKVNFTGIKQLSCSLYLSIESQLKKTKVETLDWIFIPLKEEEYKILFSFLPNINEKQMYLTFMVPFFKAQQEEDVATDVTSGHLTETHNSRNNVIASKQINNFPMMVIGIGLLNTTKTKRHGVHIILPEAGHISTSMTLSYKPNEFKYGLFPKRMHESIDNIFKSIIEENVLNF